MRFAFRVDSSPKIGMGHLMRCLTLANGLKKRGFECYFICRNFDGCGVNHVLDNGFEAQLLSVEDVELDGSWLGVPYEQDVSDTISVISENPVDWVIVDHYDIDQKWETIFRSKFPDIKSMVIDDLVNRPHDCDVLLDQTYGRTAEEYDALVLQDTQFCLGTDYALLRPAFRELRNSSIAVEETKKNKCHILVTLGGGDSFQPIQVIGKALKQVSSDCDFSVTVITGNTPHDLLIDYENLTQDVEFVTFSDNIATLMEKADFVIGAGGGTSWERCCMGLPTIVLTIADNQIEIAKILNEKRAGISVKTDADEIASAVVNLLSDDALRLEMSQNAANLCDGNGVSRVVGEVVTSSLRIESATLADAQFIYDARYADGAAKYYRNSEIPSFEDHVAWLEKALTSNQRILTIIYFGNDPVAHVRLDKADDAANAGEIGICLAADWRGKGMGKTVLSAASQFYTSLGFKKIYAEVKESNLASERVFKEAGYEYLSADSEGFMRYLWQA